MPDDPTSLIGDSGRVHIWDIRSKKSCAEFNGRVDSVEFARLEYLDRFVVKSDSRETRVESRDGDWLASCPVSFERVIVNRAEGMIAGISDGRLCVFSIENGP